LGLIVQESFVLSLLGGVLGVPLGYLMNVILYKGVIVIEAAEIPQGVIVAVIAGCVPTAFLSAMNFALRRPIDYYSYRRWRQVI